MIDWSQVQTSEQKQSELIEEIRTQRRSAYIAESDALKIEADYDAIIYGKVHDYSAWVNKVKEIKLRFPFP